jgi:hypothetical protein
MSHCLKSRLDERLSNVRNELNELGQGFNVGSLPKNKIAAFVACVLVKVLYKPLPMAVAECAKEHLI